MGQEWLLPPSTLPSQQQKQKQQLVSTRKRQTRRQQQQPKRAATASASTSSTAAATKRRENKPRKVADRSVEDEPALRNSKSTLEGAATTSPTVPPPPSPAMMFVRKRRRPRRGEEACKAPARVHCKGILGGKTGRGLTGIEWPLGPDAEKQYERAKVVFEQQRRVILASGEEEKEEEEEYLFMLSPSEREYVGKAGEILFRALATQFRLIGRRSVEQEREAAEARRRERRTKLREEVARQLGEQGRTLRSKNKEKSQAHRTIPLEGEEIEDGDDDDDGDGDSDEENKRTRTPFQRHCRTMLLKLRTIERSKKKGKDGSSFSAEDLDTIMELAAMQQRTKAVWTVLTTFLRLVPKIKEDWEKNVLARYSDYGDSQPDIDEAVLAHVREWIGDTQYFPG